MASNGNDGFLTDDQRAVMKIAAQNADVISSSPRPTSTMLAEHHLKGNAKGNNVKHIRRAHSGKVVRVKKGVSFFFFLFLGSSDLSNCFLVKSCLMKIQGMTFHFSFAYF